jgi:carboxylesterase type B
VQRSVAAFGGDPQRVTIMGESAGGNSVLHHLVSPASQGLFSAAIVQSGYIEYERQASEAAKDGLAFASALGCSTGHSPTEALRCLQAGPAASAVLNASALVRVNTIVLPGSDELPQPTSELIRTGQFAKVPLLIGTNRDEDSFFGSECGASVSAADVAAYIQKRYGSGASAALLASDYNASAFPSPRDALERLRSDETFCQSHKLASAFMAGGLGCNVFVYHLMQAPWFMSLVSDVVYRRPAESAYCLGVSHVTDLLFLFSNFDGLMGCEGRSLDSAFARAWGGLAHSIGHGLRNATAGDWAPFCSKQSVTVLRSQGLLNCLLGGSSAETVPSYYAPRCSVMDIGPPDR